jgi:hypothetical protein
VKDAKDLIPWKVSDISIRPHDGMWSFNPSIHFDGKLWRCVLRCSDYAMPNGVTIRGAKARASGTQTKNVMVIFDPGTWQAAQVFKMKENDGLPRVNCANVGYEDMRIFKTDSGGLQGIAACLHLDRGKMDVGRPEGATQHQPPEQVLINFDDEYNIVKVKPIRGSWWSGRPQKNWAPFDHAESPRFLYAIDRGTMFDENGAIDGDALVTSSSSRVLAPITPADISAELREQLDRESREINEQRAREERELREQHEREEREKREQHDREERERTERDNRDREKAERDRKNRRQVVHGRMVQRGAEVKTVRGRTVAVDTVGSRPSSMRSAPRIANAGNSKQVVSAGRTLAPRYAGLRGGTQLVHVGDGSWLGVGHEMSWVKSRKFYFHTFFLCNSHGKMTATSPPFKMATEGIEFAAGMAIDGDRVVISFGVDDMHCRLGVTSLSAILAILRPVEL